MAVKKHSRKSSPASPKTEPLVVALIVVMALATFFSYFIYGSYLTSGQGSPNVFSSAMAVVSSALTADTAKATAQAEKPIAEATDKEKPASPCTDSDGIDEFTYGSITGTSGGRSFLRYDSCVDATTVLERRCDDKQQMSSVNIPCPAGYGCDGGRCVVLQQQGNTCKDSDGSEEFISGTISGTYNGQSFSQQDSCFDSSTVIERICGEGSSPQSTNIACPDSSSCQEGRCVESSGRAVAGACTPTSMCSQCTPLGMCDANGDGIINMSDKQYMMEYLVGLRNDCGYNNTSCYCDFDGSGRVAVRDVVFFTRCLAFCGNGICENTENITCPQDCANTCADSDGNNPLIFGNVSGKLNNQTYFLSDECVNALTVKEYLCTMNNTSTSQSIACPSGYTCAGGKCNAPASQNTCVDSDGNNTLTYGNVTGIFNNTPYTLYDSCVDNATVTERLCSGNLSTSQSLPCPSGYACDGGMCQQAAGFTNLDLVADYEMDEAGGNVVSDSQSGFDGIAMNGPQWISGFAGNALQLDGSNDYVEVPDSAGEMNLQEITVSAWVYPMDSNVKFDLISKHGGGYGTNSGWGIYRDATTNRMRWSCAGEGSWHEILGSTQVAAGNWYHVAGVFSNEGDFQKLYVNGVEDASATATHSINYAVPKNLRIGANADALESFFEGKVDRVMVFGRAISAQEIADLAQVEPQPDSCIDSDGNNTMVYGNVTGYLNNTSYIIYDSCAGNTTVTERLCAGNYSASASIACPSGYTCAGGKCNAPVPNSCTDTDGQNASSFGTISGYFNNAPYALNDWCVSNTTVGERICSGTLASNMSIACPVNQTCQGGYCASPAPPLNYTYTKYIDPTYTGAEDGTQAHPYNSWNDVLPIQDNTLYLMKKGTSITTGATLGLISKNNVGFATYGTGDRPTITYTGANSFFNADGTSNILIDGYKVVGGETGVINFAAHGGRSAYNFTVRNCEIVGGWRGVNSEVWEPETGHIGNLLVENSIIHGQSTDGIFAKSNGNEVYNRITIRNNHIYDSNQKWLQLHDGTCDGDNIHLLRAENVLVENNILDRRGTSYKFNLIVIGLNDVETAVVRGNTLYPPDEDATWSSNAIYFQMGGSVTFTGNKIIGSQPAPGKTTCAAGIFRAKTATISYNLFDDVGVLVTQGAPTPTQYAVNNNLFRFYYDGGTYNYALQYASSQPFYLRNNIFLLPVGTSSMQAISPTLYKQNNIEINSNTLSGFDSQLHFANINANDFHLTSASTAAINQGVEYPGALSNDLDGASAPYGAARDIGPYELH